MPVSCIKLIALRIKSKDTMVYKAMNDLASSSLSRLILNHSSSVILLQPQQPPSTPWQALRSFLCWNVHISCALFECFSVLLQLISPCSSGLSFNDSSSVKPFQTTIQTRIDFLNLVVIAHCFASSTYHIYNEIIIYAIIY